LSGSSWVKTPCEFVQICIEGREVVFGGYCLGAENTIDNIETLFRAQQERAKKPMPNIQHGLVKKITAGKQSCVSSVAGVGTCPLVSPLPFTNKRNALLRKLASNPQMISQQGELQRDRVQHVPGHEQ
jgi:hypothetical protein